MKKPIYAKVARTCVESFLYHHPNAQVSIYCDRTTIAPSRRKLFLVRLFKPKVLNFKLINSNDAWQVSKLYLLTQLRSPNDVFLDADLKFNGRLPLINTITFFVAEETFVIKGSKYSSIKLQTTTCTNRNTSIFSWGGKIPTKTQFEILDKIYNSLEDLLPSDIKSGEYLGRLREQISISIFVDLLQEDIEFVKFRDKQFDGTFVESSYFGATGSIFSALGSRTLKSKFAALFSRKKNISK